MSRKNYLEVVNDVLAKLRQQQVSSVDSTRYSRLVGALVNQTKREVEDAWMWTDLRRTVALVTSAGTDTYSLTGFAERFRIERVRNVTMNNGKVFPLGHDDFDNLFPVDQSGPPHWWRVNSFDGNGDPRIQFWPVPAQTYTIKVVAIVGQGDLTLDTQTLLVPHWPVVLGAHALAIDERGEDGGDSTAANEYQVALTDAMARDNANQAHGWSSDWTVE